MGVLYREVMVVVQEMTSSSPSFWGISDPIRVQIQSAGLNRLVQQ